MHKAKTYSETGTNKEGTNVVTNDTMSTLDRTILMGRIRSSRMDLIVMFGKNIKNIWTTKDLTALVHKNILVTEIRAIYLQPFVYVFNRGSLALTSLTVLYASMVVGNKNPTSFTIETDIVFTSTSIL